MNLVMQDQAKGFLKTSDRYGENMLTETQQLKNDAEEAARALFFLHTSPIRPPTRSQLAQVPELSLPEAQIAGNGVAKDLTYSRTFFGTNGTEMNKFGAAGTLSSLMAIAEAGKHLQNMEYNNEENEKENLRSRALSLMSIDNDADYRRGRLDSVMSSAQSEPGFFEEDGYPNSSSNGGQRMIGAYTPSSRKKLIDRFLEKRRNRIWRKRIKYDVRKNFADSRIRVKGRFVRKEDEEQLREFLLMIS